MRKIATLTLLLLALTLTPKLSQASHAAGEAISYECISPTTIRVHVHRYQECNQSVGGNPMVVMTPLQPGCNSPAQPSWVQVSATEISPVAPGVVTACQNSASPVMGFEEFHFTGDFVFGATTCDWVASFSSCCRATSALTMGTTASSIWIQTDTITTGTLPCNSSPQWDKPNIVLFPENASFLSDQSATDLDGDDIVYSLVDCKGMSGAPAAYNPGYSGVNPMGSLYGTTINAQTGIMQVTRLTGGSGAFYICVMAEEYRNGVRIGSSNREIYLRTTAPIGCSASPDYTGITNLTGGAVLPPVTFPSDTVDLVVPPGSAFCLDITTNDPDAGTANILSSFLALPGATLTDTSGNNPNNIYAVNPIGRYCWTAPLTGTYQEVFSLQDTACYGLPSTYLVLNIIVGDTGLVWPGDANNDLIANNLDLLSLGLAYGSTGPARGTISNTWIGHFATPWADTIVGPVDKKFQDCNGDAIVNDDDTLAISLNYGLIHTKRRLSAARGQATDPPLSMVMPMDSANVGDTIHMPIYLGDSLVTADNVYGIAFSINYDATLIDSSTFSIEFSPSWIGNASNSLSMNRNHFTVASCDGVQVRKDHQSVSGMGQIATAHFIIIDNIDGKRQTLETKMLTLDFADVVLIGLNGDRLPVDPVSDSMLVYQLTVETDPGTSANLDLQLYPNPAGNQVTIASPGAQIEEVQMYNLQGQAIARTTVDHREKLSFLLSDYAPGMYFVKVRTNQGMYTRRLIISK